MEALQTFVLDTFQYGLLICAILIWVLGIKENIQFKKQRQIVKKEKVFTTYRFIDTKDGMICCEEAWYEGMDEPILRIIN